jgi:hypothetical protein
MVLILVYIGCVLAVAGGLHFMDVKFLKHRASAVAAMVCGLSLAGSAEAALIGSSASFFKAQQIRASACELEGESAHPEHRGFDRGRVIHHHIRDCMKASGYDWASEQPHCKEAPVAANPFCYQPSNAFDRMVTGAQVTFAFE